MLTPLFSIILFSLARPTTTNKSKPVAADHSAITDVLNRLVNPNGTASSAGYDKRLRPFYGEEPVVVNVTMHVTSISGISEVDMDYMLDIYLRQEWEDPRLAFDSTISDLTIGVEYLHSIWVPDTFFPNEKSSFFHEATTHNSFLRIAPSGIIFTSQRLTVTTSCPMDLHYFPLDKQSCDMQIESYGYSTVDIIYNWNNSSGKAITTDNYKLPQFKQQNYTVDRKVIELTTGNYSRLYARFLFSRNLGFYLIQIYLPSQLIVIISWVSFWLSRDATPARVSLGVTTVLTMTTLMTTTNSAMPKVSYIKSLDIYLITCFLMVFASLLEYAAVGYMNKRLRMKKETKLQQKKLTAGNFTLKMQPNIQYGAFDPRSDPGAFQNPAFPMLPQANPTVAPPKPPIYATKSTPLARKFSSSLKRRTPQTYSESGGGASGAMSVLMPINNNDDPLPPCTCTPPGTGNFDTRTTNYDTRGSIPSSAKAIVLTTHKERRPRHSWNLNPSNIDKYSRIIFPLFFGVFNAMYWLIYWYISRSGGVAFGPLD